MRFTIYISILIFLKNIASIHCANEHYRERRQTYGGLIYSGQSFQPGKYPFLAAIYEIIGGAETFRCCGNLISKKHVLTAAHCVDVKEEVGRRYKATPSLTFIYLGKHNLSNSDDRNSQKTGVEQIIVHEDWKFESKNFDADIAMIILNRVVEFTKYIKPVKIWNSKIADDVKRGTIAGWGLKKNSNIIDGIPREVDLPIYGIWECISRNYSIAQLASNRTFCAGGEGRGPCNGDSGSSLSILYKNEWYMRGLVSSSFLDKDGGCDVSTYSVYTDITKYNAWINNLLIDQQCGMIEISASSLIVGGKKTVRGHWPWLVAIFVNEDERFYCAGNLISLEHVLSTAQCFHMKGSTDKLKENEIFLRVGKYDLDLETEMPSSEKRTATKMIIHPDWKAETDNYDADIAIIKMNAPVKRSKFINPICLWVPDDPEITNKPGIVVGWGYYDGTKTISSVPREVSLKIISDHECFMKDNTLAMLSSPRTFCVEGSAKGICSGDSGSGIMMKYENRWYIVGIASASLYESSRDLCDTQSPQVFANIGKFLPWIGEQIIGN